MNINEKSLRRIEWGAAILITALCVALQFVFVSHAGGLWRDEANTARLAQTPAFSQLWEYLRSDSFPIFWVMVLRVWQGLGLGTDVGFRVLGFLVGLFGLSAMWFAARSLKFRFPFCLLIFAGLHPLFIIYGDSLRAWGWGLAWLVIEFALIWRVLEDATPLRVAMAVLVGIAAVQSTYYNSLLLFAFCCAGLIVGVRRSQWRKAFLMPAICAAAGITMLPYLNFFRSDSNDYNILRTTYFFDDFLGKLLDAMSGTQPFGDEIFKLRVWWILFMVAAVVFLSTHLVTFKKGLPDREKDLSLFGGLTIIISIVVYFVFLRALKYVTSPWYYLSLIMAILLGFEAIFAMLERSTEGRLIRLTPALIIAPLLAFLVLPVVKLRMTNMDLIAKQLNKVATTNDLVVVNPFTSMVSFERDYSASATLLSLPAVDSHLERFELVRPLIVQPDKKAAIQDVLDAMKRTLKDGGRVWIVSDSKLEIGIFTVEPIPPTCGINADIYSTLAVLKYWSYATCYFLQQHSIHHETVEIAVPYEVSKFEKATLTLVSGWREETVSSK